MYWFIAVSVIIALILLFMSSAAKLNRRYDETMRKVFGDGE